MPASRIQVDYKRSLVVQHFSLSWRDLLEVPWSLCVALFYFFPRELGRIMLGQATHHHVDDDAAGDEDLLGWQLLAQTSDAQLEKHYFYAEDTFGDFRWHTVNGYWLRSTPEIPDLKKYPVVRGAVFDFAEGIVAQAMNVGGNPDNCPLIFVDLQQKTVQELKSLRQIYRFSARYPRKDKLLLTGRTSEELLEFSLETV
ncbi:MAG: hypothetical protein AAGI38_11180 [Bacteroidota bacterium]